MTPLRRKLPFASYGQAGQFEPQPSALRIESRSGNGFRSDGRAANPPEGCIECKRAVTARFRIMQLYITPGSPYARMARVALMEKQLTSRIEILLAQTRIADSPYYNINPSGRVPYLVRDDGVGMEESALICSYLDHLDGRPEFDPLPGASEWE